MFPIYDKRDDIPEAFRDAYEERDGKWHAKVPQQDDAAALKSALEKERKAREDEEKARKAAERERDELKTKQKATETGITEEKLKEIRADVRKEVEQELAARLEAGDKAIAENRTLKLDNAVKTLMPKAGVRGERLDTLWKLVADRFDLTDDGKPMIKSSPGKDIEKYFAEEVKKEFPEFYQGTRGTGGGAGGMQGGAPNSGPISGDDIIKNPSAGLQSAFAQK